MELRVSLDENVVIWMGHRCDLTATETEIVYALQKSGRAFLSNQRILTKLYGISDSAPQSKVLSVHISRIRRKLRDAGIPVTVENRWDDGYRLKFSYRKFGA